MPIEKNNLQNANDADAETLLENDKSKDVKLIGEQALENDIVEVEEPSGNGLMDEKH